MVFNFQRLPIVLIPNEGSIHSKQSGLGSYQSKEVWYKSPIEDNQIILLNSETVFGEEMLTMASIDQLFT